MSRVVILLPGAMGTVCAAYTGIYLVRWEWNRAIIAGLLFLAAEVMLVAILVLDRLRRTEARVVALLESRSGMAGSGDVGDPAPGDVVLDAIRTAAPAPVDRFAWIRDRSGSMNVFLPVLLGAGVVASALAWTVEQLARATVSPVLERRLAERLGILTLPAGGLLGATSAAPARRRPSWPRRIGVGALLLTAGVLTAASLDFVADRTQTRPDVHDPDAQTSVELELRGAVAADDPDRIIGHLWSVCTGPDVFRTMRLPEPVVRHGPDGAVSILVDADIGEHGITRLRGCLNDATLDKVQAQVVAVDVGEWVRPLR